MKKYGQSIVEYVLITILVIMGIVYMGPFVLRSVNAHFKLWDEGVRDSFQENITQASPSLIPAINIPCTCTQLNEGCGGTQIGSTLCMANQDELDYVCNPPGCGSGGFGGTTGSYGGNIHCVDSTPGATCSCNYDPACCTTLEPQSCGKVPIPPGGAIGSPPGGGCYYGQRAWGYICGSNPAIKCFTDNSCDPICTNTFNLIKGSYSYCATGSGNPPQSSDLSQDTPVVYLPTQADCSAVPQPPTCQVYCISPYVPNSTTNPTACVYQPCLLNQIQAIMPDGKQYCIYPIPPRLQVSSLSGWSYPIVNLQWDQQNPTLIPGQCALPKKCMDDLAGPFQPNFTIAKYLSPTDWYMCYEGTESDTQPFYNFYEIYDLTTGKRISASKNTNGDSNLCTIMLKEPGNAWDWDHNHDVQGERCPYNPKTTTCNGVNTSY